MEPRVLREQYRWPALLLLLPILVHAPALTGFVQSDPSLFLSGLQHASPDFHYGVPFIDGNAGRTLQALGSLVAHDWLHGILPWWNPYSGAGMPLAACMQPGAFFLPFVLLLQAGDGVMYMKLAMQIVAGLATFAALRERGLSRVAACIGGVLFELNGTFAWFADAPIMPIAFLPMLIWGIEKTRTEQATARYFGPAIIAVALAYSLVAGFPETAFLDGLLAGIWVIDALARARGTRARLVLAGRVTAGLVCGLLLAAPAVLPFLLYLGTGDVGTHALAVFGSVSTAQTPVLALPYAFGPIMADQRFGEWGPVGGYVGSSGLFLALASLAAPGRQPGFRITLLVWLLVGLALVCGQTNLDAIRLMLPILRVTLFCRYAMPSIIFAMTVLAALAVDDWVCGAWRIPGTWRRIAAAACVWAAGIAIVLLRAWPRVQSDWPVWGGWMAGSIVMALVVAGSCALLPLVEPTPQRGRWLAAGLAVEAFLLFMPPVLTGPRHAMLDLAPVRYLQNNINLGRVFTMGGRLYENYGARYQVASIDYLSLPAPANWVGYVHRHIDPASPPEFLGEGFANEPALQEDLLSRHVALEQAGVSHALVSALHDPLADADPHVFQRVFTDGNSSIYALLLARRYWEIEGGPCKLSSAAREAVQAVCDGPARLARRELFFDDWQARVNGHRARITPFGEVFQQIELAPGLSHVRFRYVPPFANLIATMFAAGVAGLLALALASWRGRGRGPAGMMAG